MMSEKQQAALVREVTKSLLDDRASALDVHEIASAENFPEPTELEAESIQDRVNANLDELKEQFLNDN